jgi:triphosphatase
MAAGPDNAPLASRARLVSTYYDTPDHALARRGSSLRVRRKGRQFVQTVKATGSVAENGPSRGEWEDRVKGETPDPHAAQTGPFLPPDIALRLGPLFRTEVSRLTIPLTPAPATRIEAAIDRGRIRNGAGTPPEPISEVELELKSGDATALYDVALKLLQIAPLRLERRSKAERGYRLAVHDRAVAKPVHAEALDLHGSLSGETVLRRIGRACLDHLLRNEDAALAGDGEGIHQMRVAVRRLRAMLSAFAPLLPREQRRWASGELRWFGDALGEARNLDVFTATLLPHGRAALPVASEFERLARAAERRRDVARREVVKAIRSNRYTETLLELLRWFDGQSWREGADPALQQPVDTLASALLDRCRDKAVRRAKGFAEQSAKKRHRLRIALKQLRYAAELLGGLYDPTETKHFVQRLKRLQDDLGDANDVRVGRDIVDALAPPVTGRSRRTTGIAHAGHRLIAWHKRRLEKDEPALREHLDALLAARLFWRS